MIMKINGLTIKEVIKKIREKGISDAEIASYMGVSTKTIANWYSEVFEPRTEKARKLAELLENPNKLLKKGSDYEEYDAGAGIKKTEAMCEVILSVVAEMFAKMNNQSATVVKEQLQDLVNKRLAS